MKDPLFFNHPLLFSDGACSGNPGPGGYGTIVSTPNGQVKELGGGLRVTTNNQMELQGAIAGLEYLSKHRGASFEKIMVFTDSVYVIRGITQWIWGWRTKGWITSAGEPVSNQPEWKKLLAVVTQLKPAKVEWHFVRGHVGVPGNERCDQIAVEFSKGKNVALFEGPLLSYPFAIHDIPEDTSLPEMKPREAKVKVHSYLSYVHGIITRHADWASCERRVKGHSGARFKKALSAENELEILKSWGIDPKTAKIESA